MSGEAVWKVGPDRELSLDRPRLMGVLNITPDSFSDGAMFRTVSEAIDYALQMVHEGASIIDVGGESTRPGAKSVPAAEQVHRVVPVIRGIRYRLSKQTRASAINPLISVDTTLAPVAKAALDAGADIINDISAGTDDPAMLPLAASRGCGVVLMHRRCPPRADSFSDQYAEAPQYDDVVKCVREFLFGRIKVALEAKIHREAIVIDPGLGFGKSVEQNYELIGRIRELCALNYPVLSAASRKSFIGKASGVEHPAQRVIGSTAVSVFHYTQGVRLFRVHDVAAHRQALDVAAAILGTVAGNGV